MPWAEDIRVRLLVEVFAGTEDLGRIDDAFRSEPRQRIQHRLGKQLAAMPVVKFQITGRCREIRHRILAFVSAPRLWGDCGCELSAGICGETPAGTCIVYVLVMTGVRARELRGSIASRELAQSGGTCRHTGPVDWNPMSTGPVLVCQHSLCRGHTPRQSVLGAGCCPLPSGFSPPACFLRAPRPTGSGTSRWWRSGTSGCFSSYPCMYRVFCHSWMDAFDPR